MPRGNITEYGGGNFASMPTGGISEDQSGQIIAKGLSNLGAALDKREQAIADIEAVARMGDFKFDYVNLQDQRRREFFNNPDGYAETLKQDAIKLYERYSGNLKSKTKESFERISSAFMADASVGAAEWSAKRGLEIDVDNLKKGFVDLALLGESTESPEALAEIVSRDITPTDDGMNIVSQQQRARALLDESSVISLGESTRKSVITSAMSSRISVDAARVWTDLTSTDKYQKILTPQETKTYIKLAEQTMLIDSQLELYHSRITSSVGLADIHDRIIDQSITPAEIARSIQIAEMNAGKLDSQGNLIYTQDYIDGLKAEYKVSLNLHKASTPEYDKNRRALLTDFDARWKMYLNNKGLEKKKPSSKDYDDVLSIYGKLEQLYASGDIQEEDYAKKRALLDTDLKAKMSGGKSAVKYRSKSLTETLQEAGRHKLGWGDPKDVYNYGYREINNYVEGRKDLDDTGKQELREDLLVQYTLALNNIPDDQMEVYNRDAKKKAQSFLFDTDERNPVSFVNRYAVFKHPETGAPIRYNQTIRWGGKIIKFKGVNPDTGKLMYYVPQEMIEKMGK